MKKETVLKINEVTQCDDALKLYGKKTIDSAIGVGAGLICSTISAFHLTDSDDYKVVSVIALGVFALNTLLHARNLKKNINERSYLKKRKEELQNEIAVEENKILRKGNIKK